MTRGDMCKLKPILLGLLLCSGTSFADSCDDCDTCCPESCYDYYDNSAPRCCANEGDCASILGDLCNACGCAIASPWPSPFNMELGVGYRQDKLKWSIAGLFDCPNVLSELTWKDLDIVEFSGSASYVSCRNYAVKVQGDYGHIYDGKNVDSDYLYSDRKGLYSRSINSAGRGHVWDVSGAVGYRITSAYARCIITPYAGYSYDSQYLHMYNGYQAFSFNFNEIGPFKGLNSRYTAHWSGPWLGADFNVQVEKCAFIFGSFEWHWVNYRGKGCWNLRPEIGPFYHKANGIGYLATLGGNWEICRNWGIGVMGSYRNYRTHSGRETGTLKPIDCDPIRFRTKFNQAKWISWTITGIVTYRF